MFRIFDVDRSSSGFTHVWSRILVRFEVIDVLSYYFMYKITMNGTYLKGA